MGYGEVLDESTELTAREIVDSIYKVYMTLGPGLLENVYEQCLVLELRAHRLGVKQQVHVPVYYQDQKIEPGLRLDLLVNDCVIVEVKAVDMMHPVYISQTRTYLKLTGKRLGILVNFNVPLIKNGIKRIIL